MVPPVLLPPLAQLPLVGTAAVTPDPPEVVTGAAGHALWWAAGLVAGVPAVPAVPAVPPAAGAAA